MTDQTQQALRDRKFAVLLVLLGVALAIETIGARGSARYLSDAAGSVLGVAIWLVVFQRRREQALMGAIVALAVVLSSSRYVVAESFVYPLSLAVHALLALFLWFAVYAILRDLFSKRGASGANVLGAICGYIIAGAAWSRVNAATYLLMPSAYSFSPEITAALPHWHGREALFTYYAFTQVLTMGYNDVTPVGAPATTWSLFAALFGVFYTAVVVSQFVGMAQPVQLGDGNE
jgi:hypothetical protein